MNVIIGQLRKFYFPILIQAKSSDTLHQFKFISTTSIHDRSLTFLFSGGPLTCIENFFLTSTLATLGWTCTNYLKYASFYFSHIDILSKHTQLRSFLILSFLSLLNIYLKILISATLIFHICCFLIGLNRNYPIA